MAKKNAYKNDEFGTQYVTERKINGKKRTVLVSHRKNKAPLVTLLDNPKNVAECKENFGVTPTEINLQIPGVQDRRKKKEKSRRK